MNEQITALASRVFEREFGSTDVEVTWQQPADLNHGDLTTTVALQAAKKLGKNPQEIATALKEGLGVSEEIEKVEVAGPGYVNVTLTAEALLRRLSATREACTAKLKREEAPVIVEYSQPNIAKPLGAHHLLSTLIGQSIANLYEHAGYNVLKWNYIGDWGTQFGKLAVAVEKWGDGRKPDQYSIDELLELYVRFHDEAEKDDALNDAGREAFRKIEEGDESLLHFHEDIVSVTKASLHDLYEALHVSFDLDLGEAFYQDKMDTVFEAGEKTGVFTEGKEGALIVEFPEEKYPPYMVRKGDGATLYSTRDLAQMRYRIDEFSPQSIFIVTDIAQQLHFQQLEETCNMLNWTLPEFENVLVGRMRFADKSMSTRKGNIMKLEDVLSESVKKASEAIEAHGDSIQADDTEELATMMGIGAVAYGIISQNRRQNITFDWEKMLSFDGNSAPYLQYTHARAKSVLRKSEEEVSLLPEGAESLNDKERVLINQLLRFADVLEEARQARMPHTLANFLFDLCQSFNAFYNDTPILKSEGKERSSRLALTSLTAEVLKTGAEILTIRVPERM